MAEQALFQERWEEAAKLLAKAWGEDSLEHILDIQSMSMCSNHLKLVIGSPVNKLDLSEQILLVTLFAKFAVSKLSSENTFQFIASKKLHKLFEFSK